MTEAKNTLRLGSAGVLVEDGKLFLGLSNKLNKWIIPGGGVHFLESYETGVVREYKEETGLDVEWVRFLFPQELIDPTQNHHRVILYSEVRRVGGVLKFGDDLMDGRFFTRTEIEALAADNKITDLMTIVLARLGWLDNFEAPVVNRSDIGAVKQNLDCG